MRMGKWRLSTDFRLEWLIKLKCPCQLLTLIACVRYLFNCNIVEEGVLFWNLKGVVSDASQRRTLLKRYISDFELNNQSVKSNVAPVSNTNTGCCPLSNIHLLLKCFIQTTESLWLYQMEKTVTDTQWWVCVLFEYCLDYIYLNKYCFK